MKHISSLLLASVLAFSASVSQAASVLVSIKPISLIAAELLQGVTTVDTLLPDGASPHDFSLRPSDRRKVDEADLVIWIGHETEPYLEKVIDSANVQHFAWLEQDESHDEHQSEHVDEHEHEHEHEKQTHTEQDHDDIHPWLSPESAGHFAQRLSERLQTTFPNNVSAIQANTQQFINSLQAFDNASKTRLAPLKQKGFFVFHDAYAGFVDHFELNQVGYFTIDPSRKPGAKHLARLRQQLESSDAQCVFIEPQYSPALIEAITRNLTINRAELDPLASGIPIGRGGYIKYMSGLVDEFTQCLEGSL